jgi:hypothetical protein
MGSQTHAMAGRCAGWWAKALCVRNYTLLWSLSILFEVMELTFRVRGAAGDGGGSRGFGLQGGDESR